MHSKSWLLSKQITGEKLVEFGNEAFVSNASFSRVILLQPLPQNNIAGRPLETLILAV